VDIKLDFHVPLEKIASIGGAPLSRRANNHWKLQDLVSTTLQSKLKTAPAGSKIYLWLQSETVMDGQTHEQTLVPILIGAVCKTEPTRLVAQVSVQKQVEEFLPMADYNMNWKALPGNPRVNYLNCGRPLETTESEYLVLHLQRPKDVDKENPKPVGIVHLKYQGEDVMFSPDSERMIDCVADALEDNDWDEDKGKDLKAALVTKLKAMQEEYFLHFQTFLGLYKATTLSSSKDAETALNAMEIFKIYPTNEELRPTQTVFGLTGFRRNGTINRFFGSTNEVYPKKDE
jgi:hypothetical protein